MRFAGRCRRAEEPRRHSRGAGHRPLQHWPKRFCPKSWLSWPARPSRSRQDNAGNHKSHPPGWAQDAKGRDARGVGQRYAARCGSPYSLIVAWVNAAVRPNEQKAPLLETYWTVPKRQIEASVVLANPPFDATDWRRHSRDAQGA